MSWWQRIGQEFIVSFLTGSVPFLIAYSWGGIKLLDEVFKATVPVTPILYYWGALIIPYAIVVMVDHFIWKKNDRTRAWVRFLRATMREVAPTLFSLWRVIAGYVLALPFLWYAVEPESFNISKVLYFVFVGIGLLLESLVFSWLHSYAEEKWNRRSSVLAPA